MEETIKTEIETAIDSLRDEMIDTLAELVRIPSVVGNEGPAQDFLQRHGMATQTPAGEEVAGAVPFAVFVAGIIVVILSTEFHFQSGKGDTVSLLGIAVGFFNFANKAGLHNHSLLKPEKHWLYEAQCFFPVRTKFVRYISIYFTVT